MKGTELDIRVWIRDALQRPEFQFHTAPPELKKSLSLEMVASLKRYHIELLGQFAKTNRNEFRVEIRLFRSLLKNLISWSDGIEEFVELFDRSQWWEWYWYEREDDDSQFCEMNEKDERRLARERIQFNRRHNNITFPMVDLNYFMEELLNAATSANDGVITALCPLFRNPRLQHFHYLLSNASPVAQAMVSRFLGDKLVSVADSKFNPKLLSFIDLLSPAVQVNWHSDWLALSIRFDGFHGIVEKQITVSLRSPEWMWIKEHSGRRQYVLAVAGEAHSDFGQLITYVKLRAVG